MDLVKTRAERVSLLWRVLNEPDATTHSEKMKDIPQCTCSRSQRSPGHLSAAGGAVVAAGSLKARLLLPAAGQSLSCRLEEDEDDKTAAGGRGFPIACSQLLLNTMNVWHGWSDQIKNRLEEMLSLSLSLSVSCLHKTLCNTILWRQRQPCLWRKTKWSNTLGQKKDRKDCHYQQIQTKY